MFGIKIDEYVKHHDSHAAAGYFTSPFKDEGATILTVDAIGEWETVSISTADKVWIDRKETINYPHSVGILYSAFTHRCGLKPAEEEYILMGMAAYGTAQVQRRHIRRLRAPVTVQTEEEFTQRIERLASRSRCYGHCREHTSSHGRNTCRPFPEGIQVWQ